METTTNLSLPYIMPSQAQKHVTHNEALRMLDALIQLSVETATLLTPPAEPSPGARYIVAPSPTGVWTDHAGMVASFVDGAWEILEPRIGWTAFVTDEARLALWTGALWKPVSETLDLFQNLTRLGVGTTADSLNRFAAKLNGALWTALTSGEGGTVDLRYTMNKEADAGTLSIPFQSAFSAVPRSGSPTTWTCALRSDPTVRRGPTRCESTARPAGLRFLGPTC